LVIVGLLGYFYYVGGKIQSGQSSTTVSQTGSGDIAPINDSDLRVPVDNSVIDCSVANNLVATSSSELTNYIISTSTTKASITIQNIIKNYSVGVNTYLQGGAWTETVTMTDKNDVLCNLTNVRSIANIALANAKYLAENNNSAKAESIISSVLNTNQQIQNHSGSLIGYLVTFATKSNAIDLLLSLKSRGLIDANSFRPTLSKYSDNETGQKIALQYEYSRSAQMIDDIAANRYDSPLLVGDGSDSALETIAAIEKEKNTYNFEPNNTKLLYYNVFKSMYSNVDLPCGSTYNTIIPKFDQAATTSENYIGKILASVSLVSLDSINDKRCGLETKFSQF